MKKILTITFSLGLILFVVFGLLAFINGKKEAERTMNQTVFDHRIDSKKVKHLNIQSANATVKVQPGEHFNVKGVGTKDYFNVKTTQRDQTLNVNSIEKAEEINFNLFKSYSDNEIIITVPEGLKDLKVKTDNGDIQVKDTSFKKGNIKSKNGDVSIDPTPADIPLNVNTDYGDISLSYNSDPIHTTLSAKSKVGETLIHRNSLKDKPKGSGASEVTLRSYEGDIDVK